MTKPKAPGPKKDIRARKSMLARATLQMFGKPGAVIGLAWVGFVGLLAIIAPLIANSHPIAWKVDGKWSFPMLDYLTPVDVILLVSLTVALVLAPLRRIDFKSRVWAWLILSAVSVPFASMFVAARAYKTMTQHSALPQDADLLRVGFALLGLLAMILLVAWGVRGLIVARRPILLAVTGAAVVLLSIFLVVLEVEPPQTVVYSKYREAMAAGEVEKAYFTLIPYSPGDRLNDASINPRLTSPGASPSEEAVAAEMVSLAEARYGVRTYDLIELDGSVTAVPRTIDEAKAVADRLWQRHQEQDGYRPAYGRQIHNLVERRLTELGDTTLGDRYHLMGTTVNGEDLASRMIHACRIALTIGLISTSIAVFLGILIGGVLGYFAGWADLIGLRLVEVFASIPVIMLLIMIVAFYGRNLYLMMVVLGLTGWVGYAYFIRAEFLKLRKMDYVMAARATGAPLHKVLFQHMLPNGVAPILVAASFGIAGAIRTEATLSFIGLGLEEEPSWGQMLDQARRGGSFSWWLATYPGMAIFLTIFAYNLIGEALRDVMDPRAVK